MSFARIVIGKSFFNTETLIQVPVQISVRIDFVAVELKEIIEFCISGFYRGGVFVAGFFYSVSYVGVVCTIWVTET